jgi:eukaryotic-like serine/threonine-protein kinase
MSTSKSLPPGTLLNSRYEIIRQIGGHRTNVYLAQDKQQADVYRAIKELVLSYKEPFHGAKIIKDLTSEVDCWASHHHPAIPYTYDYFVCANRFYWVMKYFSGGDLYQRLNKAAGSTFDEITVTQWAIQITDLLSYFDSQHPSIILRVLLPNDIVLDEHDRFAFIDFGIERFLPSPNLLTFPCNGYTAPEVYSGKTESRTALYSLGAIMFHLLTGTDPSENPMLIFDFTRNVRPREINPNLSVAMDLIVTRAVEHKPEKRFDSAVEMNQVLQAHLNYLNNNSD